ncbi:MAG: DMT family transporter [Achromobacter sp.]
MDANRTPSATAWSNPAVQPSNTSRRAYFLLIVTTLFWGGNMVAARMAVGEISPMALSFFRWLICAVSLIVIARRDVAAHWRALLPHWKLILPMAIGGMTAYGNLLYVAASHTSGINLSIIQGAIPVFVLIGAFVFQRKRTNALTLAGVALTLVGILYMATRGHLEALTALQFNIGDIYVVLAGICYAGYALGLPHRPAVPAIVFFTALACVGMVASLPLFLVEAASGDLVMPTTPKAFAIVMYIGLGPSFIAQLLFMRGVALIGPSRAGLFINLVPIFGAIMSVLILGEPFASYHAVALACVLGGIFLAERKRPAT